MPSEPHAAPSRPLFTPALKLMIAAAIILWGLFIVQLVRAGTSVVDPNFGSYDQAITLDANGNPIIAYLDYGILDNVPDGPLRFTHCNDPDCAGGDDAGHIIDDTGILSPTVALDSIGNPVLLYGGGLRLMHCDDPDCAGGDESLEYVNGITEEYIYHMDMLITPAGHPVIAWSDIGLGSHLILCNDPDCIGWDEPSIVIDAQYTLSLSLALDSSGNAVMAYPYNTGINLLRCLDAACSSTSTVTLSGLYGAPDLKLDAADFPVIATNGNGGNTLTLMRCNDIGCTGSDESLQTVTTSIGYVPQLSLDSMGNPIIAYGDDDSIGESLRLVHCNDPNCAGANESISIISAAGTSIPYFAMTVDASGQPVISYSHEGKYSSFLPALNLLHCENPDCTPSLPTLAAPTDLTSSHGNTVTLNWVDNSSDETAFYIDRWSPGQPDFAPLASVGANITTYEDTFSGCGEVTYRVRAYRASDSTYSGYAFKFYAAALADCPPIAQPTNFTATVISGYEIHLSWQDNTADETHYRVYRFQNGQWQHFKLLGANQTIYIDEPLQCNTTYTYKVDAIQSGGNQPQPIPATVTATTTPCGPPAAPSALSVSSTGAGFINLSWVDNSPDETNFRIERSPDGISGWQQIRRNAADDTTYQDSGLACEATYYYRVRSYRAISGEFSTYSEVASATASCNALLVAPTDLTTAPISQTQIDLTWTDSSTDETSFRVERSPSGVDGWVEIGTTSTDDTTYSDISAACNTTYHYRVRAHRSDDDAYSAYSNTSQMSTWTCGVFADVPVEGKEWMQEWIEDFYYMLITTGCGTAPSGQPIYCPERPVTRAEMAVFIIRAIHYPTLPHTPTDPDDHFDDVPVEGKEWMQAWIEEFYDLGLTTGCAANPLRFCPEREVTRAETAVFLLRALEGGSYQPPAASHYFSDVPVDGKAWMEAWIDEFYRRGFTTGCAANPLQYCPERAVTRAEMAVFIMRAFELEHTVYIEGE